MYQSNYEYACQSCEHRFKVVTTFRENQANNNDEIDEQDGYPEEQPACPVCHTHDAVRVRKQPVSDDPESSPEVNT